MRQTLRATPFTFAAAPIADRAGSDRARRPPASSARSWLPPGESGVTRALALAGLGAALLVGVSLVAVHLATEPHRSEPVTAGLRAPPTLVLDLGGQWRTAAADEQAARLCASPGALAWRWSSPTVVASRARSTGRVRSEVYRSRPADRVARAGPSAPSGEPARSDGPPW